MARSIWLLVLACLPVGCASLAEEQQVHDHVHTGLRLYSTGVYDHARDSFKAALVLRPNDPDILFNVGHCQAALGQKAEAEKLYQDCLKQAPDHAEARHGLVLLMLDSKHESEAVRMVEDWLHYRPELAAPYVEDGWLRNRDGDIEAARSRYQQAVDLDPLNVRALVELAGIWDKVGRRSRALVLYERALRIEPDQPAIKQKVKELRAARVGQPRPD